MNKPRIYWVVALLLCTACEPSEPALSENATAPVQPMKPSAVTSVEALPTDSVASQEAPSRSSEILGVGIVRPFIQPNTRLYFYGKPPAFDSLPESMMPADSLVFGEGDHHVPLTYGPAWFQPEYMQLDYDALLMRALTVTQLWVEVVVNTASPRPRFAPHTMWIPREQVEFTYWPTFLLSVAAVEVIHPSATRLHAEPDDGASVQALPDQPLLQPLAVQGYWVQVRAIGEADEDPLGWLRWRTDDRLLIAYSLTM